jgi:hypothetical protein
MNYLLTLLLIAAVFAWILTLHYQASNVELQQELMEAERRRIAELGMMSQEYEAAIRKAQEENDMLRRRLG